MEYLVGIDDTDTKETRGTGFHARELAALIEAEKFGIVHGITRHQNYVHPDIPYTSQNSSACLVVDSDDPEKLKAFCRYFLLEVAPVGSDVGLCILAATEVPDEIVEWGWRAKREVLTKVEARKLAEKNGVFLEGLTGIHDGIIGALAAIGLRKSGNDGRFIWLRKKKELRDLSPGFISPQALKEDFGIEEILKIDGEVFQAEEVINVNEWFRPVLKNNKVTLIVEKEVNDGNHYWKSADKDHIRANS